MKDEDNRTFMLRTVSTYTNSTFKECEAYPLYDFLLYYRNAIVERLLQTEEGRNILKDFKRINMQDDDGIEELEKMFSTEIIIERK